VLLKRILLPIIVIVIALLVFISLKQSKPEKEVRKIAEKIWRVNTVPVKFQTLSPEITLYGRVETPRKSTLKSALVADVISVEILEGSEVNSGQLLVTLDDTDAQLLFEQRQADISEIDALIQSEQARFKRDTGLLEQEQALSKLSVNAVERAKKLGKTNLLSQSNLDDAEAAKQRQTLLLKRLQFDITDHSSRLMQLEARKKRSQALLKQAEVDIERTKVTAPFDARISQLNIAVGDRVRIGDSLLSLYDINNLEVRAQIPGRYIKQVRTMMSHEGTLSASAEINDEVYALSLERLSGEVRLDSGGIDGLFSFGMIKEVPILGTFVELNLKLLPQENVFSVPYNALYGLNHIYSLKDGYLQAVDIDRVGEYTTSTNEKKLLIRSVAVKKNDQIISTQLPNAITGLRVEALSE